MKVTRYDWPERDVRVLIEMGNEETLVSVKWATELRDALTVALDEIAASAKNPDRDARPTK